MQGRYPGGVEACLRHVVFREKLNHVTNTPDFPKSFFRWTQCTVADTYSITPAGLHGTSRYTQQEDTSRGFRFVTKNNDWF